MPNASFSSLVWEHNHFLFDAIFEGIIICDKNGIIKLVNASARQLYQGMEMPQVGFALADCSPHEWLETKRVLASGHAQLGRKLLLADSELLVNRLPIIEEGEVVAVVITMQDIEMFDEIVKQLPGYKSLHEEVETILEQIGDAFIALDFEKRVIRVNSAYERLVAVDRSALLGRFIKQIKRDPAHIISLIEQVFEKQIRIVNHVKSENGNNLIVTASPSFDEEGNINMVLVRIQDLSQFVSFQEKFLPKERITFQSPNEGKKLEIQKLCQDTGIVAHSDSMLHLLQMVLKVSQSDSLVFLQGESGVGKSMLASLIHSQSPRSEQPLIVINASAIPEEIMESELFGYAKGAFTGALAQGKVGLLEAANKGTIFLDEIGEMKYSMQAKLLEVIEKKSFIRVGCTKRISVDIRIIAATNRDLEKDVEDGLFRKDLYYRLNVIPLYVPPLRERREDIQIMAQEIIQQYNAKHKTKKSLSKDLKQWLSGHEFSGNMRELINIFEWMLVMSDAEELTIAHLPAGLQKHIVSYKSEENQMDMQEKQEQEQEKKKIFDSDVLVTQSLPEKVLPLKEAMKHMEKRYLEEALARFGSIQATADALNVHFSTLWRKLLQYNIEQKHEKGENNA